MALGATRIRTTLRADEGVTLTELMVVVTLMGFVLAAAYGAYFALQRGGDATLREGAITQEVTYPLLTLERIIIQNRELYSSSNAYTLVCTTDRDLDGQYELHTITAKPGGGLHLLTQVLNNAGQPVQTVQNADLSTLNSNYADGVPMFRYYGPPDDAGIVSEIATAANVPGEARSILLTIRSTYRGRAIEESRTIQFRNRD